MFHKIERVFHVVICGVLIIQLTGCGTILYPERRGQKAGRIDAAVAILDGIGLLFFLIPGVIAFAVDFSNGTIYLPASARSSLDVNDIKQVKFDPKHTSIVGVEKIIQEETGQDVELYEERVKVSKLKSVNEMMSRFKQDKI